MAQSRSLATTTAVMRRIEAAFATVDDLPAKQREFVMTWARAEYLTEAPEQEGQPDGTGD